MRIIDDIRYHNTRTPWYCLHVRHVDLSVEVRAACRACQNVPLVPLHEDSALAGTESSENHAFDPLP